jgi:hypothetical protein
VTLPAREALDRTKLNLFLAGPGRGEGVAIALPAPAHGWIFVDGCKLDSGEFPLHEIWRRYRLEGDPTEGIVLTHPHDDHYDGMLELIDLSAPRWLACVATHHADGGAFARELTAKRDDPQLVEGTPLDLALRRVKSLLSRIQNAWNSGESPRVLLRAGGRLPLDRADVEIDVASPDPAGAKAFFAGADLPERIRSRANELSAVLHIRYGATRLVLGADLPESDHGAGPNTGWTKVLAAYPGLPGSQLLKVPHHGSDGAQHPRLSGPGVAPPGAVWALTPFQGGIKRPVPKLRDNQGIAALLSGIPSTHLTSLPGGWESPREMDALVPIGELRPIPLTVPRVDGATDTSLAMPPCGPLDPVWLFTMDDSGCCAGKHRGSRAIEVGR